MTEQQTDRWGEGGPCVCVYPEKCFCPEEVREARERADYVESLQNACLSAYGVAPDEEECLGWLEADLTVDQAVGWMNHGCGPGDAAGCWTQDPEEAFA